MLSRPKFAKFYFPGLISLVMLPLLCVGYIYYELLPKYFITDDSSEKFDYPAGSIYAYPGKNVYKNRKFKSFKIDGDTHVNDQIAKKTSLLIEDLISKKDTINGISVRLGTHSKYGDLVRLISICYEHEQPDFYFRLIDDELIMYYYKLKPTTGRTIASPIGFTCGTGRVIYTENYTYFESVTKSLRDLNVNISIVAFRPWLLYFVVIIWLIMLILVLFKRIVRLGLFN